MYGQKFESGDRILICSDGLSEYFSDEELLLQLNAGSVDTIADQLVATAKQRGGHDNITVIIAEPRMMGEAASPPTRDILIPITREYDIP
jgi:protein phosphatase